MQSEPAPKMRQASKCNQLVVARHKQRTISRKKKRKMSQIAPEFAPNRQIYQVNLVKLIEFAIIFVSLCALASQQQAAGQTPPTRDQTPALAAQTHHQLPPSSSQPATAILASSSSSASSSFLPTTQLSGILKRDLSAKPEPVGGSSRRAPGKSNVCQVNDGESVAIVEIEESRGSDMGQSTNPAELPIGGSVEQGEIELRIESETHKYFQIQDKRLRLTRPLDRDPVLKGNSTQIGQPAISSIYLQISCTDRRNPAAGKQAKKVIIPVLVKVLDLNDNAPKFSAPIYAAQIDELAPVGSVVLDSVYAVDLDSANNGQVEYSLVGPSPGQHQANQRLVQRAPADQSARTTTTTTTSTVAPLVTGASANGQTLATTVPSGALNSSATSDDDEGRVAASPQPVAVAPPGERQPQSSTTASATPTINLNSEPILNGPVEELEEEESDEALLASLAGTTNSTGVASGEPDSESGELEAAPRVRAAAQSAGWPDRDYRKRRRRRHLAITTVTIGEPVSRRWLATTTVAPANFRSETSAKRTNEMGAPSSAPTTRKDALPWTNLLLSNGDDLHELAHPSDANQPPASDQDTDYFALELAPQTNRPIIRLKRALDYESRRVHKLTIMATDLALNRHERLTSYATILVRVLDGDDQPPAFVLDQSGCATGSLPQTTTPTSLASTESDQAPAVAPKRHASVLAPADTDAQVNTTSGGPAGEQPDSLRGFKVTDESFDFGDVLALDDSPIEEPHANRTAPAPGVSQQLTAGGPLPGAGSQPKSGPTGAHTDRPFGGGPPPPDYHQCLSSVGAASQPTGGGGPAEYFSTIMSGESEYLLRIVPQAIRARDRDELNAPIRYSFVNGTLANYSQYFQINPLDAVIKQVAPIERAQLAAGAGSQIVLWIQAQEVSPNRLFSLAKLTIEVTPTDKSPPVLVPNSYEGRIEENAPIGSRVLVAGGGNASGATTATTAFMRVGVLDADTPIGAAHHLKQQAHTSGAPLYEFDTTSDAFKVDRDGFVYVNKWPLDRDAPNQAMHMFQVTARQLGLVSSRSVSSPVSLNVSLVDLNDNPPVLVNQTLGPVQMLANSRGGVQSVSQVRASDRDLPENSRMHFSLRHVSNGGKERFRMDEDTGHIEALGKFAAGEQFSLTVQVADELGRAAQGIVEVLVVPGANTGGPQFVAEGGERDNARGYWVEVNEGVAPHSVVLQVHAVDPENDPITYSIVAGNVNHDFSINSRTGALSVVNRLDREEIAAYQLLVQARDSGGLASSRPVTITVTDSNDENPVFNQAHYVFAVNEGVAGVVLGRVGASDADAGDNGRVSYSLTALDAEGRARPAAFAIDNSTGDIRLLEPLDYERARAHSLLVVARDHGEKPRSASASVQVRVLDVQDEAPYFERHHLEARLDENLAGHKVVLVQARDPDSVAQISYLMLAGDSSLFAVDQHTGLVSTLRGLDYEQARRHTILVGTSEALALDIAQTAQRLAESIGAGQSAPDTRWPIVRVDVLVNDLNDNAPEFESAQPLPVRVQDSAQLGTVLARLQAHDRDGSSPNNQIRYELVGVADTNWPPPADATGGVQQQQPATSDRCAQLFMVDATSGEVSVRADLRRDSQSECQLVVRARDLAQEPEASLSSFATLTVFIDHLAEISPASMIGFADTSFTVELAENAPANTLLKVLPVVNKPKVSFPMSCEIVSGNELARFYVQDNEQRDCELRVRDNLLDFELRPRYSLTIKLNTLGTGNARTLAQVQVNILDRNDNRPVFHPPSRYSQLTQNRFLAAISSDSPSETQVIQLRASDADATHSNGLVSYELLNEQELEGRFKVDPVDGIIRTGRPVEDIPGTRLPIRLKVMARDNPEQVNEALDTVAEVVLNLIDDRHRIGLALKDTPAGQVLDSREELLGVLQERTGLISGLERVESLKLQRNSSLIEPDVTGTDVWFYLIEPGSLRIVTSDDSRVRATLFEPRAQRSLLDVIGQTLGFSKARVRLPYSLAGLNGAQGRASPTSLLLGAVRGADPNDRLAPALVLIALAIAVISAVVVVYQCGSAAGWSSASQTPGQQQQQMFAKDKLFFAPIQYPLTANSNGSQTPTGHRFQSIQDPYAMRSAIGATLAPPGAPVAGQPAPGARPLMQLNEHHQPAQNGCLLANSKEYETQMLKMSVLFDDSHSLDEHNLNEHHISKDLI